MAFSPKNREKKISLFLSIVCHCYMNCFFLFVCMSGPSIQFFALFLSLSLSFRFIWHFLGVSCYSFYLSLSLLLLLLCLTSQSILIIFYLFTIVLFRFPYSVEHDDWQIFRSLSSYLFKIIDKEIQFHGYFTPIEYVTRRMTTQETKKLCSYYYC